MNQANEDSGVVRGRIAYIYVCVCVCVCVLLLTEAIDIVTNRLYKWGEGLALHVSVLNCRLIFCLSANLVVRPN